jgi:hypothetical protein
MNGTEEGRCAVRKESNRLVSLVHVDRGVKSVDALDSRFVRQHDVFRVFPTTRALGLPEDENVSIRHEGTSRA